MSYQIICPRCDKKFKVENEEEHSKIMKKHEIDCPDIFFDKLKEKYK